MKNKQTQILGFATKGCDQEINRDHDTPYMEKAEFSALPFAVTLFEVLESATAFVYRTADFPC